MKLVIHLAGIVLCKISSPELLPKSKGAIQIKTHKCLICDKNQNIEFILFKKKKNDKENNNNNQLEPIHIIWWGTREIVFYNKK